MVDYFLMYNSLNIKNCRIKVKSSQKNKFYFLSILWLKKFYNFLWLHAIILSTLDALYAFLYVFWD